MSGLGEGRQSLDECRDAIAALRAVRKAELGRPATADAIQRAESVLGVPLPPSLRFFVETVGRCIVGQHELLGLQGDDFAMDVAANVVGATLIERRAGLPPSCIVFENADAGGSLVVDADHGYVVRRWVPGGGLSAQVRADFGSYLLKVALDEQEDEQETRE